MNIDFRTHLQGRLHALESQGLLKSERVIASAQGTRLTLQNGREVLNLCANNYLGLAADAKLVAAAKDGLDRFGFGMASVRFICGTQEPHRALEVRLAAFLHTDDAILFSSCWDANGGVFEVLLGAEDAVISDALNHASIIDGIRLCKAKRFRYANGDLGELESRLSEARAARFKLVVTDGVFSMDGVIANLEAIVEIAHRHRAMVMVDDSHAVGFVGASGRGSPELRGVLGKVDILTGTFGKALGGASGGYVAATSEIVAILRQQARPYLFSNSLAPSIAVATLAALDRVQGGAADRAALEANASWFRGALRGAGFRLAGEGHPIIPVMIGEARLARDFAEQMLDEGVYVVAFSYPVVPEGKARIRTQLSAAHTREELQVAVHAFTKVGKALGVIP